MQILGIANSYASAPVNAPTSLSNVPSTTSVAISYTPPTNDGGSSITNYEYSFNLSSWTALSPADTTSPVTVSGLTAGTAYTVYLRAVNIVGSGPASTGTTFTTILNVEYLVIAGGGGGGSGSTIAFGGGSGGAGGYRSGTLDLPSSFTVTIGGGGSTAALGGGLSGSGSNSVFSSITSTGGGGGGASPFYTASGVNGGNGGSGGGGASAGGSGSSGGTGTSGQGNNGGAGGNGGGSGNDNGSGGGAGGAGQAGVITGGGKSGGAGSASSITGSSVTRAVGGTSQSYVGGASGAAGGANTGTGGGGGAGQGGGNNGGAGGSGVVILAYPSSSPALTSIGGGLTYSVSTGSRSGYRVYTFTGGTGTVTL
jgi:hypothetical protein